MEQESLKKIKNILQEKLTVLEEGAEKTLGDIGNLKNVDMNFSDTMDLAAWEEDSFSLLRIRDRERKLMAKIKEALKKIEEGSFGICEACGGEITEKRLLARPVTTLCIQCKTKQEAAEQR